MSQAKPGGHHLFGQILLRRKIVTNQQLEKALALKDDGDPRMVGEIVSATFDIPMAVIDGAFIHECLTSVAAKAVAKELSKSLASMGISGDAAKLVNNTLIQVPECTRQKVQVVSSRYREEGGMFFSRVLEKESKDFMKGTMRLRFEGVTGESFTVVCPFVFSIREADMRFEHDLVALLKPHLLRLIRALKARMAQGKLKAGAQADIRAAGAGQKAG